MDKIWLRSYPAGVPAEINPDEYASINDMLARACRKFADRPAFRNLDTTITFAQLDRLSRDFAAWLQSRPGLQKGSRIALMMPNLLQYPIALFGVLRAGMIVVNVNPLYTARELENQLTDSGAEAIVILENFAHVLETVLAKTAVRYVVTTGIGDVVAAPRRWLVNFAVRRVKKMVPAWHIEHAVGFRTALRRGARMKWNEPALGLADIAFLQYTGGTTGISKGAILTHRNVIANVLQSYAWTSPVIREACETMITALPLYHIYCLTVNCLLGIQYGALNLLITNPRDMPGFIKELSKSKFTIITGVNTLFNGLLHTPGFAELDFSGLKFALGGGAAVQRAVAERWQELTGAPMVQGYGLTETSPIVACHVFTAEYDGTVGPPIPSTEIQIRDDEDRELPSGREGEICVRGPQVMQGYWQKPGETEKVMTRDGWLRTGDIGVFDERGFLRITDRKKDMIIVSGFNVYPNEVEGVIAAHPGVLECAVVGIPDSRSGEAVKAFVVKKDPELTSEALVAFCHENLTNYKIPKFVEFRGDLPKNQIGKVLRRELRPAREYSGDAQHPNAFTRV
jgi:long-chain acyl-CoA synthetase